MLVLAFAAAALASAEKGSSTPAFPATGATSPVAAPGSSAPSNVPSYDESRCGECHGGLLSRKFRHGGGSNRGRCAQCHLPSEGSPSCGGASNGKSWKLKAPAPALCAGCHEQRKLLPSSVKHAPVVEGRCLECHDPHGSDLPNGLRAAGKALCLRCHQAPASGKAGATTQIDLSRKRVHNPVRTGDCQDCHVQTHSSKARALLKANPVEVCTKCHDTSGTARQHPVIDQKGCTACHDAHSSDTPSLLVAWPQDQLCYSCHPRKDQRAISHAPVAAGECLTCHDPHSGEAQPLLIEKESALCFGCHPKEEVLHGPELHTPVAEEGCSGCHDPHGGDAPKNLRVTGKAQCLSCHDSKVATGKGVFSARSIDTTKRFVHEPFAKDDCQKCHESGHGAKYAKHLRAAPGELCYSCHNRKDDQRFTHGAVTLGDCAVCHSAHSADNPSLLTEPSSSKLCFRCHQDDLTGRAFIHKPAGEGKCGECHDPHGSKYRFNLVASEKNELCERCHAPRAEVKVKHKPLERYGCGACHDPHGTGNPSQLIKPVNELCIGCHERYPDGLHATSMVSGGHVVSGKSDPRRQGRAFTCASCHDPHGSDNDQLFYFGQGLVMCDGCHGDRTGRNKELKDITRRRPNAEPAGPNPNPTVSAGAP